MKIEVCYAVVTEAVRVELELEPGVTVGDAVDASRIVQDRSLDPSTLSFAFFGRRASPETVLDAHDRVEILRPLLVDPKEARHRRVATKMAKLGAKSSR